MSTPGDYSCCSDLDALTMEPRLAGHHALCPELRIAAIEKRHAAAESAGLDPGRENDHEDRAVLLAALREARAEVQRLQAREAELLRHGDDTEAAKARQKRVLEAKADEWLGGATAAVEELQRLRPIVEEVRGEAAAALAYHAAQTKPNHPPNGLSVSAARELLRIVRHAGTLASIPPDECDGSDR